VQRKKPRQGEPRQGKPRQGEPRLLAARVCGARQGVAGQVEKLLEIMVASSKSGAGGSHRKETITKSTGPLSSSAAPTETASGPCMQVAEITMVKTPAILSAGL